MAAFATMSLAEARVREKVADKTWVNAHSERGFTGTISVRVQRFMSAASPGNGAWASLTDDAAV